MTKYPRLICALLLAAVLLCGCTQGASPPDTGDTISYKGLTLAAEDYAIGSYAWSVPYDHLPILTAPEKTLAFTMEGPGEALAYGYERLVQIRIDTQWFTLLPRLEAETRVLARREQVEREIDLSAYGALPAGLYRYVDMTRLEFGLDEAPFAQLFCVAEPDGTLPDCMKADGPAQTPDLLVHKMRTANTAQPVITTRDAFIRMTLENMTAKTLFCQWPKLEVREGTGWQSAPFWHANVGLAAAFYPSWVELLFDKPMKAGEYRLTVPVQAYEGKPVSVECLFTVQNDEDAPPAAWDASALTPSLLEVDKANDGIRMAFDNDVLTRDADTLCVTLTADRTFYYGEPYRVEVELDGIWYYLPYATATFTQPLYSVSPETDSRRSFTVTPTAAYGTLPKGRYRLLWTFDYMDDPAAEYDYDGSKPAFTCAEFTVAEELCNPHITFTDMARLE